MRGYPPSEDADMQHPKTQFLILRQYCRTNGHEIARAYVDHKSGKDSDRPGFKAMIERAMGPDHPYEAVVILRLDRFIRNAEEGMSLIKKLEAAKVHLILVKDTICGKVDKSTPIGEFFVRVLLALGELERKQTAARVSEGIHRRIHEGSGWGRQRRNDINVGLAIELLKVRGSLSAVSEEMNIPRNTLRAHFEAEHVDYRTYLGCRNTPCREKGGSSNILGEGGELSAQRSLPTPSEQGPSTSSEGISSSDIPEKCRSTGTFVSGKEAVQ